MMEDSTSGEPALAQSDIGVATNTAATAAKQTGNMPDPTPTHEADPCVPPAARCKGTRATVSGGWPGLVPEDLLRSQWPVPERPGKPDTP